jgi:hypothetical protein
VSKPPPAGSIDPTTDGPVEDMIVAGTPSGELASSLLTNNCLILLKGLDCLILYSPFKPLIRTPLRGVVGFFGFHHDQKLAL